MKTPIKDPRTNIKSPREQIANDQKAQRLDYKSGNKPNMRKDTRDKGTPSTTRRASKNR